MMKHMLALLAAMTFSLTLSAMDGVVKLNLTDVSYAEALKSITEQTGCRFAYNSRIFNDLGKLTLRLESDRIEDVLDAVFSGTGISYSMVGKQIALYLQESPKPAGLPSAPPQARTVSGVVMDEGGEPLPGAGIVLVGRGVTAVSDLEGRWSLEVFSDDDVIAVDYIGMEHQELSVGNRRNINIILKTDNLLISQLVVTGYQTLSRERSSGSFSLVDGAAVQSRSNSQGSALRGLEGSVAGLNVNESAEGTTYLIRGMTSINSKTEPLYIVDGVPVERKLLKKMVNPNDVENVTFLKDATAASIWGAQAANGVIVFTTKTGRSAKPAVSYNGTFTYRGMPDYDYMDMMDSREFIAVAKSVFDPYTYNWEDINATTYGGSANYPIVYPHEKALYAYYSGEISLDERDAALGALAGSNWRDSYEKYFMSESYLTTHSVSISGGGDLGSYYLSLEYQGEQGTSKDRSDEYRAYFRDVVRLGDFLRIDASLNALYSRGRSGLTASDEFSSYSTTLPYAVFTDADGSWHDMSGYFIGSEMLANVREKGGIDLSYYPAADFAVSTRTEALSALRGNLGITADITGWLTYEGRFQYSVSSTVSESYYPEDTFQVRVERAYALGPDGTPHLPSSGGQFTSGNIVTNAYTVRNQLSLNKEFGSRHAVAAIAGFEFNSNRTSSNSTFLRGYDKQTMQYIQYDDFSLLTSGVSNPLLPMISGATANEFDPNGFSQSDIEYRFVSVYSNASYTLDGKYSLNASVRVDQSNLFGSDPSVQFKPIWSVGGIWNIKKENFLSGIRDIDRLNLRMSYGLAGNSPNPGQGGPYNLISSVSSPNFSEFGLGYVVSTPANDKLCWEKTRTWNTGIDVSAFSNRLSATFDVYDKYTTDLLTHVPVDPTTGFTSVLSNIGEMSNRGFELSLQGVIAERDKWSLDAFLNVTYNRNRLESMYITPPDTPSALMGYDYWEGYPYGTIFAYGWAGLDPANGLPRVHDGNGAPVSHVADVKDAAAVEFKGSTIPSWFGSFGTTVRYGGLSLSCLFVYNLGHVLRNDVNTQFTYRLTSGLHRDFADRWQKPGDEKHTDIPAYFPLSDTSVNESDVSSLYRYADVNVLDASFVKLRDLSLSYSLPSSFVQKTGARAISAGIQASNLLTLAFNGERIDPEAFSLSAGVRSERFRPYYTFNLNIEF